jgi:hypothetical protein
MSDEREMTAKASDEEPDVEAHALNKANDEGGEEDEPDVEAHALQKQVQK